MKTDVITEIYEEALKGLKAVKKKGEVGCYLYGEWISIDEEIKRIESHLLGLNQEGK